MCTQAHAEIVPWDTLFELWVEQPDVFIHNANAYNKRTRSETCLERSTFINNVIEASVNLCVPRRVQNFLEAGGATSNTQH